MEQGLVKKSFSIEELVLVSKNSYDKILLNEKSLSKSQVVSIVRNLRDLVDRYS